MSDSSGAAGIVRNKFDTAQNYANDAWVSAINFLGRLSGVARLTYPDVALPDLPAAPQYPGVADPPQLGSVALEAVVAPAVPSQRARALLGAAEGAAVSFDWVDRTHAAGLALSATAVAGPTGITRLITSTARRVPAGQSARGVGKPLENVGFAGITPVEAVGPGHWRIAVKNNSPSPLRSEISIHTEGGRPPARRSLFLNPGTVTEFEYSLPPECGKAVLRLPTDAFPADNELLLVRSAPAPVAVSMGIPEQSGKIFLNIIHSLPGFSPVPDGSDPDLLLLEGKTENARAPGKAAIIFTASGKPSYGAVTAERHPLTDGLNWSGLLIPSIGSMKPGEKAGVLLWQGESPLAWVDGKRLFLNWPWEKSNADRVPAPLLMTRRFMQSVQENLPGTHYGNLPGGTLLSMPAGGKLIQTMPGGERRETVFNGRLPEETGYVEIFPPGEGKTPLFQGSVWFSDARMGDFSHCSTFDTGLPQPHEEALRHMKRDPLAPLWLALVFLALILSWLPPVPDTSLRP